MGLVAGIRISGEARALRFLLICLIGWVLIRILVTSNPAAPFVPEVVRPPWPPPSAARIAAVVGGPAASSVSAAVRALPASRTPHLSRSVRPSVASPGQPAARGSGAGGLDVDLHRLRFAMMTRFIQPSAGIAAIPARGAGWGSAPAIAPVPPGLGQPFWMQRQLAGWSIGGWIYLRDGSGGTSGAIAAEGQLGGSQAGVRLSYGFGGSGRLRAYGRATIAVERPAQRDLAAGFAFAPVKRLPVDIAIEQRVAAGRQGRTALAAYAAGGVSNVALPAGFQLDAYAQAGVVGARQRDGFADGAVVIDHRLGAHETAPLRLGALAAAAIQPGTGRVDIGPRLTLKLPDVGHGSRIAIDWRQRIAGDARPESGAALTLATDF